MSNELFEEAPPLRPPLVNTTARRELEPTDEEKLKEWQRERLERRLRGDYELATKRLSDLISSSVTSPARIADVRVQGPTTTRSSFLGYIIRPHLSSPTPSAVKEGTLEDVFNRVHKIADVVERTDNFSVVEASLERSRSPLAEDQDVDVVLRVKDKSRFFLKGSTEAGNSEGSATVIGRMRNAFGGAETLEGSVSFGTQTKRAFQGRVEAPITPSLNTRGEVSLFQFDRDNTVFASSSESVSGARATIRTPSFLGKHEIAYEAALRRIRDLSPAASASMRQSAGLSVKSAVSHTFVHDSRDSTTMGTSGSYLKLVQEVAGLGGDAHHIKNELDVSASRSLFSGLTASLSVKAGAMLPLFGKQTLFNDRFQLGGPTSLRMFRHNGLGPKDGVDSLGGELIWATGLSLISDIPYKRHWPLKLHTFVNAGRLGQLDTTKPIAETARDMLSKPSVSVGAGLIYMFNPIRLEVNFGVPLVASKSDSMRRGLQVGIGLDFL